MDKRVLVVDDNPAMAKVIAFNLVAAGMQAVTASNGQEAWDQLAQQSFDLVVTDYQMPILDGRSLVQRIRQSSQHRRIPVILLTAKEMELDTPMTTEELHLLRVLQKPFSPSELVQLVTERLNDAACTC